MSNEDDSTSKSIKGKKSPNFTRGVTQRRNGLQEGNVTPSPMSGRLHAPTEWTPALELKQGKGFKKSPLTSAKVKIHDQETQNNVNFIKKQASNILKRLESDKTVSISHMDEQTLKD